MVTTTPAHLSLPRESSSPPVSIMSSGRGPIWPSACFQSRVVPGMGFTMAKFFCARRLNSVDLPTFGRPIMATDMRFMAYTRPCTTQYYACTHTAFGLPLEMRQTGHNQNNNNNTLRVRHLVLQLLPSSSLHKSLCTLLWRQTHVPHRHAQRGRCCCACCSSSRQNTDDGLVLIKCCSRRCCTIPYSCSTTATATLPASPTKSSQHQHAGDLERGCGTSRRNVQH